MMDKCFRQAIEDIYSYRKDNIILGLTGRTGSGCSTVAKILQTQYFKDLDLADDNNLNEEDMKVGIVHNFLQQNQRWQPFCVIEVSNVILSFVLEKGKTAFIDYLDNLIKNNNEQQSISIGQHKDFEKILSNLESYFDEIRKYPLQNSSIEKLKEVKTKEYIDFYLQKLTDFKNALKQELRKIKCSMVQCFLKNGIKKSSIDLYSFLMQKFGNNLRANGNCFDESEGETFNNVIMRRIEDIIWLVQRNNTFAHPENSLRICIDSLRNPIEIIYLKDRYSYFYQISVNADEKQRRNRLSLREDELQNLDRVEYPQKYEREQQLFYHQDIQKCLEFSSIHIHNENITNGKYTKLTEQLIRYIALMIHPGLITPTKEESCMQIAFNAKFNSGCLSRQVGAVITSKDWSVKAVGWNNVPAKQLPCNLRNVFDYCKFKNERQFSEFEIQNSRFGKALETICSKLDEKDLNGMPYCYCFKDVYNALEKNKNQVHTRSLHAEENAFLQISKYGGQGICGGKLFVTASPCELCSKKSYQLGIRHIYYIDPYPGIAKSHILAFGNDTQHAPQVHLFQGAVGDAYVALYSQRLAVKDELAYITGLNNKKVVSEIDSPKYEELKCTDIVYKSIKVYFTFQSRTQIHCETQYMFTPQIENIRYLEFITSWTGSSFDNIDCKDKNIVLQELPTGNKTVHKYRLDFGEKLQKGKSYSYTIETDVRDVDMVMIPYVARKVQHVTKQLEINLLFEKDAKFIKEDSIQRKVYADKEMQQKLEEAKLSVTPNEKCKQYTHIIKNPHVNYSYSIEWKFDENA